MKTRGVGEEAVLQAYEAISGKEHDKEHKHDESQPKDHDEEKHDKSEPKDRNWRLIITYHAYMPE